MMLGICIDKDKDMILKLPCSPLSKFLTAYSMFTTKRSSMTALLQLYWYRRPE